MSAMLWALRQFTPLLMDIKCLLNALDQYCSVQGGETSMKAITIQLACEDDLKFIDHLQKRNAEELAFFPKSAFEREIENQRIVLARVNDTPAGYLYHGQFNSTMRIHQACIEYDLRKQAYGAALIRNLIASCELTLQVYNVCLRCGSDIEANDFWRAMGFMCVRVTQGGARRMRDINHWIYEIRPTLVPFAQVDPSSAKQDARAWAKSRKSGIKSNRFVRGKGIKVYRDIVLDKAGE